VTKDLRFAAVDTVILSDGTEVQISDAIRRENQGLKIHEVLLDPCLSHSPIYQTKPNWGILQSGGVGQEESKKFNLFAELQNAESSLVGPADLWEGTWMWCFKNVWAWRIAGLQGHHSILLFGEGLSKCNLIWPKCLYLNVKTQCNIIAAFTMAKLSRLVYFFPWISQHSVSPLYAACMTWLQNLRLSLQNFAVGARQVLRQVGTGMRHVHSGPPDIVCDVSSPLFLSPVLFPFLSKALFFSQHLHHAPPYARCCLRLGPADPASAWRHCPRHVELGICDWKATSPDGTLTSIQRPRPAIKRINIEECKQTVDGSDYCVAWEREFLWIDLFGFKWTSKPSLLALPFWSSQEGVGSLVQRCSKIFGFQWIFGCGYANALTGPSCPIHSWEAND